MARMEKVTFRGALGDRLAARLELPDGTPQAFALFAHCFTCSKDVFAAHRIAANLADRGIATLRFDFTGLGASDGEFANTSFASNVGDLVAAADHLRKAYLAPRLLIGHSLGGAAALAAAAQVPEAQAVATINAPAEPSHVLRHLVGDLGRIASEGEGEVSIGGRSFRIRKSFLDDIAAQPLVAAIGGLDKALIVFHAPLDQVVGIDNAAAIFAAARHPKSFVALDGADHLLSRREDAVYVADLLAAWAARYVDRHADLPGAGPVEAGTVTVRENRRGKFGQDVLVGRHRLHADEPVAAGGEDAGPSPYQLLAAALGTCTSMTMRMYADLKAIPLERATVHVRHDKVHAADCADCETREGKIDLLRREIELEGPLDADARRRLLAIADKCPVHRTLHAEVRVETTLKE
ncbi:MAG: bifunctional alpha/beta hydrolase/OsmC family protein [Rhodospirillaceae bacterium]